MSHRTESDANIAFNGPVSVAGTTLKVSHASGNLVERSGDNGLWDTVAGKKVLVDQTTVGTTLYPKM